MPPWGRWSKTPGAAVAAPGFTAQSQNAPSPPSDRRRWGHAQGRSCAKSTKPASVAAHRAANDSTEPRRNGRGWCGYAPACCGRLHESVPSPTLAVRCLYVTKDGSPTRRPASLLWSFHTTPQYVAVSCGRALWPCRRGIDLARVRAQAGAAVTRGCRVGHVSIRERAACASLSCCESWRWRGCALCLMAATLQRKQFPLRCAHSSRDKFFSLPGSPRCCDRCAVRPAHPRRPDHNKDALARPCSTRKEKHHG